MDEIKEFKEVGLTEYEAKAYLSLVKLGKSSSVEISKESGVSYGKIYQVLGNLEQKHLVKIVPEKTKKFVATDPENIIKLIEKKENTFKKLKSKVKDLRKIYEKNPEEVIKIIRGKKNFYKIVKNQPKPKKYIYTVRYTTEYQPTWEREHKSYLAKGIDNKALVRNDEETKKNVQKWLKFHPNTKKVKNNGIAISIVDDKHMFIAMIKSNIIMEIKDKYFIDFMKTMFMETYKNSKNISLK